MTECYLLDEDIVKQIEWQGDSESYDLELRQIGPRGEPFIVKNPWVSDSRPFYFIDSIPDTESCVVWNYKGEWQAKYFPVDWRPCDGYITVEIEIPQFIWRKNPDIDRAMTFEEDVFGTYKPDSWQAQHELVWYIDPRFNPLEDKVWAISCKPVGRPILGIMDMGFITPQVDVEYNKDLPQFDLDIDSLMPPYWELSNACAYRLDPKYETDKELYVIVIRPRYRNPKSWSWKGIITPQLTYTMNKHLPQLNIEIEDNFTWHDLFYEHVWYIDSNFLYPGQKDVWLVKAKATNRVKGSKYHGGVSPKYRIDYNPEIPKINYDLYLNFKIDDLAHEHIWYLHSDHHPYTDQKLWAVKITFTEDITGQKHHDDLRPTYTVRVIKQLKDIDYNFNIKDIQYFDFVYTNCFYMKNPNNDVLAVKVDFVKKPIGSKHRGYIQPIHKIEYNCNVKNIKFKAEHEITFDDRNYLHVWYLNNADKELIWLAKSSIAKNPQGEKTIAILDYVMPEHLDVFFISYDEPNAEENWARVKNKAPYAIRIDGIEGIFNAYRAAAEAAKTDIFYVVDGDAWLLDDWNFDFQPNIFEREFTHVWLSQNPFNDLNYGYGGVKLFSKEKVLSKKIWKSIDYTCSINKDIKVMDKVSNITVFNTTPFNTWRSAFRETIKLLIQKNTEKIDNWVTKEGIYFEFARQGVEDAKQYYKLYSKNNSKLNLVNNYNFLSDKFFNRSLLPNDAYTEC